MKIGRGVSELWGVENRPLQLTRPMAYTTACTTVQAVISITVTPPSDFGVLKNVHAITQQLTPLKLK